MSQPQPESQAPILAEAHLGAGTLYTLLAAAGFAAVSTFTSLATATGLALATVLAWRYLLGAVVMGAWVFTHTYKPIPSKDVWTFIIVGGLGQATMLYLALSSLQYITAATLAFLFYTYPAWVTFFQAMRGAEPLTARRTAALVLSLAGIVVMVGLPGAGGAPLDWRGVGLALSAAIVYGAFIPIARIIQKDHPVAPPSFYGKLGSGAIFVVLALIGGDFTFALTPTAWWAIIGLTLLSTVLPSVFFLMGLIRLGPVRTAIVSTIEPFLTALLGVFVLKQSLTGATLLGGVLIVAAVVVLQIRNARMA